MGSREDMSYQSHIANQHPEMVAVSNISEGSKIKNELKIEQEQETNFQCDTYDENFASEENISSHITLHHDGVDQSDYENDPIKIEVEETEWKIESVEKQEMNESHASEIKSTI